MRPAIASFGIFTFMWSWNNYLWPLLVLNDPEKYTVPVALSPIRLTTAVQTRRQLTLQNQGAAPVTLGHDPSVQYGQGLLLNAGASATTYWAFSKANCISTA